MSLRDDIAANEEWRTCPGFPRHEVSSLGRIRHKKRRVIMRGSVVSKNRRPIYVRVGLYKDKKIHLVRLHRLVLEAFKGSAGKGQECCHNDGNPLNNKIENLRWDSHKENMKDARLHGTASLPPVHRGEKHPNARLSDDLVSAIRSLPYTRGMFSRLGRQYGVSHQCIRRYWNGISR